MIATNGSNTSQKCLFLDMRSPKLANLTGGIGSLNEIIKEVTILHDEKIAPKPLHSLKSRITQ